MKITTIKNNNGGAALIILIVVVLFILGYCINKCGDSNTKNEVSTSIAPSISHDFPKFVPKKNGSIDPRATDLEDLCKDWLFYRNKIYKYSREGKEKDATKARTRFQQINASLREYKDSDVQSMFSAIEKSGYVSP